MAWRMHVPTRLPGAPVEMSYAVFGETVDAFCRRSHHCTRGIWNRSQIRWTPLCDVVTVGPGWARREDVRKAVRRPL
ncbi:hypothetical protein GCM10020227_34580 [Streptomyces flavovirens]